MKKKLVLKLCIITIFGYATTIFAESVVQKFENTAKGVGNAILEGPKNMATGIHKMFSPTENRKRSFEVKYQELQEKRALLLDPKYDNKYRNRQALIETIYALLNDITDTIIPMFEGSSDKAKKLKKYVADQKQKIQSIRYKKPTDYTQIADIVSNLMTYLKNELNTWSK